MKKSFILKRCLTTILILSFMLCTGCWNRKELKELGIIGAVAIDDKEDKVKLTYEVILPKKLDSMGSDDKAALFFDSEGNSVFDAIRNATLKYDKKLYWPHTNIVYFSEDCAKNGLQNYLDLFNRDHDIRKYIHLLIVKDIPVSEIMNNEWQKGVVPSRYVESISEDYVSSGQTVSTQIFDFLKIYYTQGIEPVIGAISIEEYPSEKSEKESEDDKEKETTKLPLLEGLYVFKDDQMIGYLDALQTKSYNIITNKIKSGIIVSDSPDNKGITSVEIKKSSCDMTVEFKDEKFQGNVSVTIHGMLGEESGKESITNTEVIKKIEKLTSETLKLELEDCIEQVQEYKSDVFGFGQTLHIKNADEWKKVKDNWNDIFADMEITVDVKTFIEEAGISHEQLRIKEKELNG